MNLHKIMIGIGIFLLLVIPIWLMFVVPELLKMPGDYERKFNLLGTEKPNYEIGGNSEEVLIYNGIKRNKWTDSGNNEILADFYFKAETISGEPLFEISKQFDVNKKTREITSELKSDKYLIPPLHLEKKNYNILDPTNLVNNQFKFIKEEKVKGLDTFFFNSVSTGVDSIEGYSFLELVPEVYNAVDDISNEIWVEPTSGIMVNFKQSGEGYYVDKETNEKIHKFTEYTNKFSDDTIANQVRLAQNEKQRIYLIRYIVPILLGLVGIALIFASFIGRRFMDKEEKLGVKPIIPMK